MHQPNAFDDAGDELPADANIALRHALHHAMVREFSRHSRRPHAARSTAVRDAADLPGGNPPATIPFANPMRDVA